ncbi:MAG: hypothetical protein JNK65_05470 [Deltaproteobacteria bacterium]|nr:hypothetical protein [Deltaproteobacteria bacterium]
MKDVFCVAKTKKLDSVYDTQACAQAMGACFTGFKNCVQNAKAMPCDPSQNGGCQTDGIDNECKNQVMPAMKIAQNTVCGFCGDGIINSQSGEICDSGKKVKKWGVGNSDIVDLEGKEKCSSDCKAISVCGNGVLEGDEDCDGDKFAQANLPDNKTCNSACIVQTPFPPPGAVCGNGVTEKEKGELCDYSSPDFKASDATSYCTHDCKNLISKQSIKTTISSFCQKELGDSVCNDAANMCKETVLSCVDNKINIEKSSDVQQSLSVCQSVFSGSLKQQALDKCPAVTPADTPDPKQNPVEEKKEPAVSPSSTSPSNTSQTASVENKENSNTNGKSIYGMGAAEKPGSGCSLGFESAASSFSAIVFSFMSIFLTGFMRTRVKK